MTAYSIFYYEIVLNSHSRFLTYRHYNDLFPMFIYKHLMLYLCSIEIIKIMLQKRIRE